MVDIPNIFAQGMGAFDDQTKRLRAAETLRASKQAGSAIASGDYTGGANVFNRAGMVEEGHNVLADQQVIQDRQTAATNTAQDRQTKLAQQKLEAFGKLADMAATLPQGQRLPWLQQHADDLVTLGLPADKLSSMTEDQLSDQSLKAFKAALGKATADFTLTHGQTRFDGQGKQIAAAPDEYTLKPGDHRYVGTQEVASLPEPQKYMPVTAGGSLVPIPNGNAPPAPVMAPANPAGGDPGAAIDAYAKGGGATVTSAQRTPEHNAEVGGVPNSHHLTGQARDLIPPPGATVAQLAAEMRRRLPGSKVIEEADHVHVQWGGPPSAQAAPADGLPAGTIRGPAKPVARPATAEEKAAYGVAADVPAQMHPDGSFAVITGTGAAQKRVPPKIQAGYADNAKGMTQIDQAIAAIKANPHALGLKNVFGDTINQRMDPEGVSTRASVANIGSQIIHDRSGAAVTAAETPRLLPFIPSVNDKADAAIIKLQKLKEQYQNANDQIDIQFGEDSGYAPLGGAGQSAQTKAARPPAPAKTPPAAPKVIRYDAHGSRVSG